MHLGSQLKTIGLHPFAPGEPAQQHGLAPVCTWATSSRTWACIRLHLENHLKDMGLHPFAPGSHARISSVAGGCKPQPPCKRRRYEYVCTRTDAGVIILLGASSRQGSNPGCEKPGPKGALKYGREPGRALQHCSPILPHVRLHSLRPLLARASWKILRLRHPKHPAPRVPRNVFLPHCT